MLVLKWNGIRLKLQQKMKGNSTARVLTRIFSLNNTHSVLLINRGTILILNHLTNNTLSFAIPAPTPSHRFMRRWKSPRRRFRVAAIDDVTTPAIDVDAYP